VSIGAFFPFKIDWSKDVIASRQYRTVIAKAISGKEMRSGLRGSYIRAQQVSVVAMEAHELNHMKWVLFKHAHEVLAMPWYVDQTVLTAEAAAAQKILQVESVENTAFAEGQPLMLISAVPGSLVYEYGGISTITNGYQTITLGENLTKTWPAGTLVFPYFAFSVSNVQELNFETSGVGGFRVDAVEVWED
jgi:hypothetical protein